MGDVYGRNCLSHLPAIFAAKANLIFPRSQDRRNLESFFRDLSLSLFDSSATRGKLIGHLKLYGEGGCNTTIRANVTGLRESVQVDVRNFKPEKKVKLWVNLIAYARSEEELRGSFLRTMGQLENGQGVILRGLRISHNHGRQ